VVAAVLLGQSHTDLPVPAGVEQAKIQLVDDKQ
jgi:hypothetical protein